MAVSAHVHVHPPAVVILAAGRAARFGRPKQLEPVGPRAETLLDYAVYDAVRAGFGRVIMVVSPENHGPLAQGPGRRLQRHVPLDYVEQDPAGLPAGRLRPWGTAHAVLAAAGAVSEPFVVLNADDFYGAAAYGRLAEFLRSGIGGHPPTYAVVGYRLADTLPTTGVVSRALCACSADGHVLDIEELAVRRDGVDARTTGDRPLAGDAVASMNMWGFDPTLFAVLGDEFERFRRQHGERPDAEFLLPRFMNLLLRVGRCRIQVLPGGSEWCGLTHATDRLTVVQHIRARVARGDYPDPLWT